MSFIYKIFSSNKLTNRQYYFPYFFDEYDFKKSISAIGLTCEIDFSSKTNMAERLRLLNNGQSLNLEFGTRIMVDNHFLTTWKTNTDIIDITIFPIVKHRLDFNTRKIFQIDISKLVLGKNQTTEDYELTNFVSYLRKSDLKYSLPFSEHFVIIIINKNNVELIPFDWFNKTGGDYGYVWPAIAQLDIKNNRIIGKGMRMNDFTVDLGA